MTESLSADIEIIFFINPVGFGLSKNLPFIILSSSACALRVVPTSSMRFDGIISFSSVGNIFFLGTFAYSGAGPK